MSTVKFTELKHGSKDDYLLLNKYEQEYIDRTADRIIKFMSGLNSTLEGYKITRLEHSLQTATRALNDEASEEMIVAALLHDIGDEIGSFKSLRVCRLSTKTFCKWKNSLDNWKTWRVSNVLLCPPIRWQQKSKR